MHRIIILEGNSDILKPVPIRIAREKKIADRDKCRRSIDRKLREFLECSISIPLHDGQCLSICIGGYQIRKAIPIEVTNRECRWVLSCGRYGSSTESNGSIRRT